MLSRRTCRLGLLMGGWVLLVLSACPVFAQEETKPEETPKPEVEEAPTPWPPPNTTINDIKRSDDQEKGLILHTPKSWKRDAQIKPLRLAQFSIPAAQGDSDPVELAVFSFEGLGGGGGVQANVNRWVSQFPGAGTKKSIMTGTGHQGLYVLVDLEGTYQPPAFRQDEKPIPSARMLAAIIGIKWDGKDAEGTDIQKSAVYFLKMVGPKKTVTENEEAFRLAFGATNRSKENPIPEKEE